MLLWHGSEFLVLLLIGSVIKMKQLSNNMMMSSKITDQTLRAPICVVMGHVDAGKTTLLDAICSSNIVSKEPGKIT